MIVVAGFNTAIDKRIELDVLRLGEVQRALSVHATPGGKGVHVARTIAALGEPVQLVGLIDEVWRAWFDAELSRYGVEFHGVATSALRTCITVCEADRRCTEVLEAGTPLNTATRDALFETLRTLASQACLVVLSGSLPPGCDDDSYARLIAEFQESGTRCLVDSSGEALRNALTAAPHLLKPNRTEAAALCGHNIDVLNDALRAIGAMAASGVTLPLLSLGGEGALLGDGNAVLHAQVKLESVINPVGSGDCLLGGVAVGLARHQAPEMALRLGVACGAANAATIETGCAPRAVIDALLPRVRVTRLPIHADAPLLANDIVLSPTPASLKESQA